MITISLKAKHAKDLNAVNDSTPYLSYQRHHAKLQGTLPTLSKVASQNSRHITHTTHINI